MQTFAAPTSIRARVQWNLAIEITNDINYTLIYGMINWRRGKAGHMGDRDWAENRTIKWRHGIRITVYRKCNAFQAINWFFRKFSLDFRFPLQPFARLFARLTKFYVKRMIVQIDSIQDEQLIVKITIVLALHVFVGK